MRRHYLRLGVHVRNISSYAWCADNIIQAELPNVWHPAVESTGMESSCTGSVYRVKLAQLVKQQQLATGKGRQDYILRSMESGCPIPPAAPAVSNIANVHVTC